MEKIRKGNDIEVKWAIYAGEGVNEAPYNLTGKDLSLYVKNPYERKKIYEFTTDRHILTWMFWGKDQNHLGKYTLELVENEGIEGMHTVDECDAFQLVNRSCEADNDPEGRVECIHLQFRSSMSVGFPAIGTGMEVDSVLSLVSENPVQNKVITEALMKEENRAKDAEAALTRELSEFKLRLTNTELSLELQENSLVNVNLRLENLDDRLSRVEKSQGVDILVKVEALSDALLILNSDAETEGSVEFKIAQAMSWSEIE